MDKDLTIGLLNELYGSLLTEKQREAVKSYYDYDLSLGEIAENLGITRQAVRDLVAKGETALRAFEDKLGLQARIERLKAALAAAAAAARTDPERAAEAIGEIEKLL